MLVDVWQIDLNGPAADFDADCLDSEERERWRAYRPVEVKRRFVRSHAALRGILSRYVGRPPETLRFAAGPQGKPYLLGSALPFNLAHSGDIALVAVSKDAPVGVDVEQDRPLDGLLSMAEMVFHAEEIRRLRSLPEAEHRAAFFECWVRREALVKGLGLGLAAAASVGPAWKPGDPTAAPGDGWQIQGLEIEAPYRAAVAVQADAFEVRRLGWSGAASS